MNIAFVDSGFWIARRDEKDGNHRASVRVFEQVLQKRFTFVITPLVFAEAHAHFSRMRISRERVIRDCWENPIVRIEQPSVNDQDEALRILRSSQDKTYSFCDAVSFAVMLRLNIDTALSFDEHFRQFGRFAVLDGN